jgi:TRAP-type C4-dicarboxylate transport system substrate-binding protein
MRRVQDDQRLRHRRPRSVEAQALALTLAALLAGCGGGQSNKAGASSADAVTLHVAVPDANDEGASYFARAVARRSGGSVRVVVDGAYDNTDTAAEAKLVDALEHGRADAAYMPARDWAVAGISEFRALSAPFAVTTSAAAQAVATSDVARDALAALKPRHLVGLGLVPDEPRRVLSRRPLLGPADFRSAAVRVVLAPDLARAISALGGRPVEVRRSPEVAAQLESGALTGTETSAHYALNDSYAGVAPYLTAFAVAGKFQVIAVAGRVWSKLDGRQRDALRKAAADAVAHARELPSREQRELAQLCRGGAVITRASGDQVAAIAGAAKAPAALAGVPGSGPQPLAGELPAACTVARDAPTALAAVRRARLRRPAGLPRSETTSIPDGTYVTTTTVADFRRGNQYGPDWERDVTWTFRLRDGRIHETQKPDYPDQGPCSGRYAVDGDTVTFTWDQSGGCSGVTGEKVRWSYLGGKLSFEVVDVQDTASKIIYAAHPWRRTG